MIKYYDEFLYESYGSNKLVESLTEYIFNIINDNIGKLILKKDLTLDNCLKSYNDIKFVDDTINIRISNKNYANVNVDKLIIDSRIFNLKLNIDVEISSKEIENKKLFRTNKICDNISHEMMHIIELYLTEKNQNNRSKSWDNGKILQELVNKYPDDNWQDISYFCYSGKYLWTISKF